MTPEKYNILIVDDETAYSSILKKILKLEGFSIDTVISAEIALEKIEKKSYNLILTDLMMNGIDGIKLIEKIKSKNSTADIILMTAYATIENAIEAVRKGADSYFVKGNDPEELISEIKKIYGTSKLKAAKSNIKENEPLLPTSYNKEFSDLIKNVKKASKSNVNILLLGESGVGKEVFAKYIHHQSQRKKMPFVPVNCHALQESVLESELFGHKKGSFTGAESDRIGRFESANGGSLFLDEIADTPLSTQIKLLRVLDQKKIERIGSNEEISVDFRLITATNKPINQLIEKGEFREDFFYRISTIIIEIPPLRSHPEDISKLFKYFVDQFSKEMKITINSIQPDVLEILKNYSFPGNIRELKNIAERLIVFCENGIISADNLPKRILKEDTSLIIDSKSTLKEVREFTEKEYIKKILKENNYRMEISANILGITRRQLTNKVSDYNIKTRK